MYFLDFDRTIFKTDDFIEYLKYRPGTEHLSSLEEPELASTLDAMAVRGELTFEPGELRQFVYADSPEFLRFAGNEATIITFGNTALQKIKIQSALHGIPRISVFYTDTVRKGLYLLPRLASYGKSVLVDDSAVELESAADCLGLGLYEMRRDKEPGDGRWPVISSLNELP
ncbi:MAG: hypothetical protein JWN64_8 [Parcubacteria group bacterium]|nr:hypothetical protein [Parcubacteria group bacterium]